MTQGLDSGTVLLRTGKAVLLGFPPLSAPHFSFLFPSDLCCSGRFRRGDLPRAPLQTGSIEASSGCSVRPRAAELLPQGLSSPPPRPPPCSQCFCLAQSWSGQLRALGSVPPAPLGAGGPFPGVGAQSLAANRGWSSLGQLSLSRAPGSLLCRGCGGGCWQAAPVRAGGTGQVGKHCSSLAVLIFCPINSSHPNHSSFCWSRLILSDSDADTSCRSPASPLALF